MTDIGEATSLLTDIGIDLSGPAVEFLQEFQGLRLSLPDGGVSFANFDVCETVRFMEEGELTHLQRLVGQSLCPVGMGGSFLYFIAPSSEIVLLHDEWFQYIRTKNVHDFFELVCSLEFQDFDTVVLSGDQKPLEFRDQNFP